MQTWKTLIYAALLLVLVGCREGPVEPTVSIQVISLTGYGSNVHGAEVVDRSADDFLAHPTTPRADIVVLEESLLDRLPPADLTRLLEQGTMIAVAGEPLDMNLLAPKLGVDNQWVQLSPRLVPTAVTVCLKDGKRVLGGVMVVKGSSSITLLADLAAKYRQW